MIRITPSAIAVPFDNVGSPFTATNVQSALIESVAQNIVVQATASTTTTTTGTTDALLNAMSITPAAGTYLVWFNGTSYNATSTRSVFFSIYAGGVKATDSEREIRTTTTGSLGATYVLYITATSVAQVTVNGSQAIECRWRVNSNTGTCLERSLTLLRIA